MDLALACGHRVRKLRRARGLTQARLAKTSGLDRTFISLLERGLRQPSLTTIFHLARALNVAPGDFVGQIERSARSRTGAVPSRRL